MSSLQTEEAAARATSGYRACGVLRLVWAGKIWIQRFILIAASVAMALLIVFQVVGRYLLGTSVYGIEELASYCAIWLYFIGGAVGAQDRGHISASLTDVLIRHDGTRQALKVLTSLITVILTGWMTWWAIQYLEWTASRGARSMELGIAMAWVHAALPIGLGLMTLYFLIGLFDDGRRLLGAR